MVKWTLEEVNERLKAGRIGVTVCQRGDRLSLRGTFPAKPGIDKPPYQQYLAVDLKPYLGTYGSSETIPRNILSKKEIEDSRNLFTAHWLWGYGGISGLWTSTP
ncbi:MAG: hypothetical protein WCO29_08465 [Nostocales cyanobacterium ELA583]|jgi:hypothetical protein